MKYKNIILRLIFLISFMLWSLTGTVSYSEITSPINYKPPDKTGVKIPIRDFEVTNNNTFEFDLIREDVRIKDYIWSVLWKKDFGFYLTGVDPENKDKLCPYIGEEEKQSGSEINEITDGKHHIILVLSPPLIDAIIENGCAVSPKPRKTPNYGNDSKHLGNSAFPIINNY